MIKPLSNASFQFFKKRLFLLIKSKINILSLGYDISVIKYRNNKSFCTCAISSFFSKYNPNSSVLYITQRNRKRRRGPMYAYVDENRNEYKWYFSWMVFSRFTPNSWYLHETSKPKPNTAYHIRHRVYKDSNNDFNFWYEEPVLNYFILHYVSNKIKISICTIIVLDVLKMILDFLWWEQR